MTVEKPAAPRKGPAAARVLRDRAVGTGLFYVSLVLAGSMVITWIVGYVHVGFLVAAPSDAAYGSLPYLMAYALITMSLGFASWFVALLSAVSYRWSILVLVCEAPLLVYDLCWLFGGAWAAG